jgi:hypothetical protein
VIARRSPFSSGSLREHAKLVANDTDRTVSRLDLAEKMPTLGLRASGAELAMKRRGFITLIGGAP